mmetsp:Transcript_108703/g.316260  ORF Transcript_108703/g.316260 Transcript_108703/m.316260 type:complete len:204 (+) Transcript_108703:63-674(+)
MRGMGTAVVIRPLSPGRFDPVRPGTTNSPPSLTAVATIDGALVEVEIGERPNLVHVIARVLNGALIAVLDDVLKEAQTLEHLSPVRRLVIERTPQCLHDDAVLLVVVGIIRDLVHQARRGPPVFARQSLEQALLDLSAAGGDTLSSKRGRRGGGPTCGGGEWGGRSAASRFCRRRWRRLWRRGAGGSGVGREVAKAAWRRRWC